MGVQRDEVGHGSQNRHFGMILQRNSHMSEFLDESIGIFPTFRSMQIDEYCMMFYDNAFPYVTDALVCMLLIGDAFLFEYSQCIFRIFLIVKKEINVTALAQ